MRVVLLSLLSHGGGQLLDLDLAARLVAAARTGCQPCQRSMAKAMLQKRATLAALAGAIYGTLPAGPIASVATREWAVHAQYAKDSGRGLHALASVEAMTDEHAADLLEDTLDGRAATHRSCAGPGRPHRARPVRAADITARGRHPAGAAAGSRRAAPGAGRSTGRAC
jgi:hypothetical protein